MKRLMLIPLGALAVIASLIPAAQAGTLPADSAHATATAGSANTLAHLSAAPQTVTRRITLPQHECAVLLGKAAGCAMSESIHLSRISASDGSSFYQGYLQACARPYNTGGCDTHYWWVKDYFNFTATSSQAWNNGTPNCSANHTNVTWCSYVGNTNGTGTLQEGFNFGNGGWARMDLNAHDVYDLYQCDYRGPSWANVFGWATDEADGGQVSCIQG
ncbi:MAG: hypothetical protein JOY82_10625 [Streptosporangiaceae bacterium]|nr:hypothetical protein [Streptosporangiaceae bacterium]